MKAIPKTFWLLLIVAFITNFVYAATVDTVLTYSSSMKKNIKAVVVKPEKYSSTTTGLPVVYLLHGYSGDYANWITKVPEIKQYADNFNCLIVCPDGNFSSWYFDSPIDSSCRYETYISSELIQWIDKHYKTIQNKKGRAIAGLSMGGHGALYLAFRHQDVFGAAGSMSGGVDITPFPKNWDMAKRLGSYSENEDVWKKNTVINLTHLLTNNSLALIIDCGVDDFFYKVNVALHEKLLYNNIAHDFISRPGAHTWEYWKNAVQYQMVFFNNYFTQKSSK